MYLPSMVLQTLNTSSVSQALTRSDNVSSSASSKKTTCFESCPSCRMTDKTLDTQNSPSDAIPGIFLIKSPEKYYESNEKQKKRKTTNPRKLPQSDGISPPNRTTIWLDSFDEVHPTVEEREQCGAVCI